MTERRCGVFYYNTSPLSKSSHEKFVQNLLFWGSRQSFDFFSFWYFTIWTLFMLVGFVVSVVFGELVLLLYSHMPYHKDTIIKTKEYFFINICTSHFIVRVRKGLLKVCVWEGVGDRTETAVFWPQHSYGRQRCVFLVLLMLNRWPRGPLCWVMAFFTASYQHLLWTPTHQGPNGPFGLMWLSLPLLVHLRLQL